MCEQLRDLVGLALFDLGVKTLNDHLTQSLTGAHDIGGVDGLIRRDQYEALAAMDHGGVCGLVGTDRVVLDRLVGAVFHKRHMLVCCCVVDQLRSVFLKDAEHSAAVAD